MNNEKSFWLDILRFSLSGALVGVCFASIFWQDDLTAQSLLAIMGFGITYITLSNVVRNLK